MTVQHLSGVGKFALGLVCLSLGITSVSSRGIVVAEKNRQQVAAQTPSITNTKTGAKGRGNSIWSKGKKNSAPKVAKENGVEMMNIDAMSLFQSPEDKKAFAKMVDEETEKMSQNQGQNPSSQADIASTAGDVYNQASASFMTAFDIKSVTEFMAKIVAAQRTFRNFWARMTSLFSAQYKADQAFLKSALQQVMTDLMAALPPAEAPFAIDQYQNFFNQIQLSATNILMTIFPYLTTPDFQELVYNVSVLFKAPNLYNDLLSMATGALSVRWNNNTLKSIQAICMLIIFLQTSSSLSLAQMKAEIQTFMSLPNGADALMLHLAQRLEAIEKAYGLQAGVSKTINWTRIGSFIGALVSLLGQPQDATKA